MGSVMCGTWYLIGLGQPLMFLFGRHNTLWVFVARLVLA
jgi:hypothetical protein